MENWIKGQEEELKEMKELKEKMKEKKYKQIFKRFGVFSQEDCNMSA